VYTNRARWVFWSAAALLIGFPWAIGIARFARGPSTAVAASVERAPLPIESQASAAIAAAFTHDYLTLSPGDYTLMGARAERLRGYMGGGDGQAGFVPATDVKPQAVLSTWVHGYRDVTEDGRQGTFVVQALVESAGARRAVYLAVPVGTDGTGRWVVTHMPHFVAAPRAAQVAQQGGDALPDQDGAVKSMLAGFLKAVAGGTAAEIAVYMAPGATAPQGLAGTMRVQVEGLGEVRLYQEADGARAEVQAMLIDLETGATYRQGFRIRLTQVNGRWAVTQIQ
jgi:hypothetical protein